MEVGLLVERVDALDGARVGALGSVEQEVVSTALTVVVGVCSVVTPGVSTERHHQVTLTVQFTVCCHSLKQL